MTKDEAMKLALDNICGAKLCEINSMSSRHEMLRLMDEAITALRQALEQPEQFFYGQDPNVLSEQPEQFFYGRPPYVIKASTGGESHE